MAKEKMTGWPIGGSEKKLSFRKRNAELIDAIGSENIAKFRKAIGDEIMYAVANSPYRMSRIDLLSLEEYILSQVYNGEFQLIIPNKDFARDIIKEKIKRFDNKRKGFIFDWEYYVKQCELKYRENYKFNENRGTDWVSLHIPVKVQDPIDSPLHDPEDDPADSWYNQKHLADLH